jgi:hypothetical protein
LARGFRVRPRQIQWPGRSATHARGEKSLTAAVVHMLRQNSGFDEVGDILWLLRFVVVLETPGQGRTHHETESYWMEIAVLALRRVLSRSCRVCFICTAARDCLCLARRSIHLLRAASWSAQSCTMSIDDGGLRRRVATALPNERALRRCRATTTRFGALSARLCIDLALLPVGTRTWLACGSPRGDGLGYLRVRYGVF